MPPPQTPTVPPLTILVVDDEEPNRRLIEKALGRHGHRVIVAESGEQGLELYLQTRPDLILMDVMMPGWNGFETTRQIRAADAGTGRWAPLIFLSAMGATHSIIEGLEAGGDDYLTKPVDLGLLDAKIATMHRIGTMHRELSGNVDALHSYYTENEQRRHIAASLMERLMRHDKLPADGHVQLHVRSTDGFSGDLAGTAVSEDGRDYLMLADAAGHGLTAAINVIPVVDVFHALAERGYSLQRIAATINTRLRQLLPVNHYVAILLACADPVHGEIEVLNAGMPPAILRPADGGNLIRFPSTEMPLGVSEMSETAFSVMVAHAEPGSHLLMFSDGLPEARNGRMESFGRDRIDAALLNTNPENCINELLASLDAFLGDKRAHDDVSLARLTIRAPEPHQSKATLPDEDPDNTSLSSLANPSGTPQSSKPVLCLTLGPQSLRNADLIPQIINMIGVIGLMPQVALASVSLALRELVLNAIDHGLLDLPERTRRDPDERRLLRSNALAALTTGDVGIQIEAMRWHDGEPCWRLTVTDSGYRYSGDENWPAGGGLARVAQSVLHLEFDAREHAFHAWLR